ncbi:hypothetical protein RZS08_17360 [Arthrospira platensis SPKY1]|nr:hypothetical protein [Arthrospira platensis SPKY1]
MSAEQTRIIEAQQQQIKQLNKLLTDIVTTAQKNAIKSGDIQSGGTLKEILDEKQAASITRYGCTEAYLIPADLLRGFVR